MILIRIKRNLETVGDALVALIRALVVTKLNYCCSVLVGVSGTLLRRLHSVLNIYVYSPRRQIQRKEIE